MSATKSRRSDPVLFLTRHQAASATGVSLSFIDAAIRSGDLRAKKHTDGGRGKILIAPEALRAWVDGWADA